MYVPNSKFYISQLVSGSIVPSSESTLQLCTLQNLIIDTISIIIMRKVGKQSALLSKDIIYCCLYGVSVYRAECQLPSPGPGLGWKFQISRYKLAAVAASRAVSGDFHNQSLRTKCHACAVVEKISSLSKPIQKNVETIQ